MEKKKISDFCKSIREQTGLSQNAFAIENNISHTTVNKIENGVYDKNPSPIVLARIAHVYGFDINDAFAYGFVFDDVYLKKLNSCLTKEYKGTPPLASNNLLNIFNKTYVENNHSSDECWDIVIGSSRDDIELDNCQYCEHLISRIHNHNAYVYCIKDVSTINSDKDKRKLDTLFSKIVFNSLYETIQNNSHKNEYKEIFIVTGSEKIYNYLLNKYKNNFETPKYIFYRLFYCSYGKYKNNVVCEALNKSNWQEYEDSLPEIK